MDTSNITTGEVKRCPQKDVSTWVGPVNMTLLGESVSTPLLLSPQLTSMPPSRPSAWGPATSQASGDQMVPFLPPQDKGKDPLPAGQVDTWKAGQEVGGAGCRYGLLVPKSTEAREQVCHCERSRGGFPKPTSGLASPDGGSLGARGHAALLTPPSIPGPPQRHRNSWASAKPWGAECGGWSPRTTSQPGPALS